MAHNSIEKYSNENKEKNASRKILFELKTPLKCGIISHLNLIWFKEDSTDFEELKSKIIKFTMVWLSKKRNRLLILVPVIPYYNRWRLYQRDIVRT